MLGYRYLKSAPTVHTILFKNGVAIKKGSGTTVRISVASERANLVVPKH